MSLFNGLERRNVFRVGVAYLLAAWVLLQVVNFVLDAIFVPDIEESGLPWPPVSPIHFPLKNW